MSVKVDPPPLHSPFVDQGGALSKAARFFLSDLWRRTDGNRDMINNPVGTGQ